MSKDRDRIGDDSLDPTASADDATHQVGDPVDLSDPETDAPDSDDIAAQIEEAELAQGLATGTSDDDLAALEEAELVGDVDDSDDLDGDDPDGDDLDGDDLDGGGDDAELADAELTTVGVGAGSNRAKARQTGARAGVTAKKEAPTKARVATATSDGGPISRLGRFLREVVAELRKVIWPSQKQMVTYTIVVIAFLVFMVALVAGLDVLFHLVVSKVFS